MIWLLVLTTLLCAAVIVVVAWLWRNPLELSDLKLFQSDEEAESFTRAIERQLAHHDYLDCHHVLRVFNRQELKDFYGAEFDEEENVIKLTEQDPKLMGFITQFDSTVVAAMTDPAALRRHLGISHEDYDERYSGDLYVVVFDLNSYSYEMNNWHVHIRDPASVQQGFQDDGDTTGGSREMEIPELISVKGMIRWIERVSDKGRHKTFRVRAC